MATLKDLCKAIPESIMHDQVMHEWKKRQALSYASRLAALDREERVFDICRTSRPRKGKYKNRYSKEEAGVTGTTIMGIRAAKHTVVVCKCKKQV